MELAKTQTTEAVSELICMTRGQRRYVFPLSFPQYTYSDLLIGIDALGETKNPYALIYLKYLYTPQSVRTSQTCTLSCQSGWEPYGCVPFDVSQEVEIVTFPYAQGLLREKLDYVLGLEEVVGTGLTTTEVSRSRYSEEQIEMMRKDILQRPPHSNIVAATLKLENYFNHLFRIPSNRQIY